MEQPPPVSRKRKDLIFSFSLLLATMASAGLRDELTCCICMDLYTDPVALTCGHSFCRLCIGKALDTQEGSGAYKCPECRAQFQERPALEKNRKLCNIVETFLSTPPEKEEVGIFCTYCIQSPVPAVKTCLLCEASLCENHLRVHSKSAEHVLTKPTTSLENKKCHIHKKVLEYYCCEDAACICVSCSLAGVHRGHQVENLIEAAEKEKEKLRNILKKVTSERGEAANRIQNLQELSKEVLEKAADVSKEVTTMIKDIRKQLEVLEDRVLSVISMQAEQVSLQVSHLIQQLEKKKEELSKKMGHIKELCNMTDPLTVLQGRKSVRADYCAAEEGDKEDTEKHDIEDLDVGLISVTLHSGLDKIWTSIERQCHVPAELLLDVNMVSDMVMDLDTASNKAIVSDDLKTVYWTNKNQRRPDTSLRFKYPQVLSTKPFSSGRHYWEVEVSKSGSWVIGVMYPTVERRELFCSWAGRNENSWSLIKYMGLYTFYHNNDMACSVDPSCERVGIFLDYEAGRLSFYELCDPIKHLHTFTATFTEPLHAVFGVGFYFFMSGRPFTRNEEIWVKIIR